MQTRTIEVKIIRDRATYVEKDVTTSVWKVTGHQHDVRF